MGSGEPQTTVGLFPQYDRTGPVWAGNVVAQEDRRHFEMMHALRGIEALLIRIAAAVEKADAPT